jgi:hypothetical protein
LFSAVSCPLWITTTKVMISYHRFSASAAMVQQILVWCRFISPISFFVAPWSFIQALIVSGPLASIDPSQVGASFRVRGLICPEAIANALHLLRCATHFLH